jgi:diadenosine tetraphosphate (Ap4A) HIT family hydrolase
MDCAFCDATVIERQKIAETKSEIVLYNIRAANKGHCIVVSRRHTTSLRELTESETASLFATVRKTAEKLKAQLKPDGFNYGFNEGKIAGQSVDHLHVHILPRFEGDNLPKHHLFHRPQEQKRTLSPEELKDAVDEFRNLFITTEDYAKLWKRPSGRLAWAGSA